MARRNVTRGAPPRLARSRSRQWSRGTATAAPRGVENAKPRPRRVSGDDDDADTTLGVYFREMSSLDVMSPEEELREATRIADLRTEYWKRLLAYPPFADGIVALVEEALTPEDVPTAALRAIRRSARALRDRETREHKDRFEADKVALANAMTMLDTDGLVSDRVLADLIAIDAGARQGISIAVRPPRREIGRAHV